MRFKGTTVLFLVFLVLGGYVYFTEFRGKEDRQKREEAKKKAFPVDEKDITEISLIYPDRTITGVKKGEKQWQITAPPGLEADPDGPRDGPTLRRAVFPDRQRDAPPVREDGGAR